MSRKIFIATILVFLSSLILFSSEITSTKIIKNYSDEKLIKIVKHYKSVISDSKSINFKEKLNIEFESSLKMSIFPNPVEDDINIKTDIEFDKIDIYNVLGLKIKTINNHENHTNLTINFNTQSKGIYFIHFFKNNTIIESETFVK